MVNERFHRYRWIINHSFSRDHYQPIPIDGAIRLAWDDIVQPEGADEDHEVTAFVADLSSRADWMAAELARILPKVIAKETEAGDPDGEVISKAVETLRYFIDHAPLPFIRESGSFLYVYSDEKQHESIKESGRKLAASRDILQQINEISPDLIPDRHRFIVEPKVSSNDGGVAQLLLIDPQRTTKKIESEDDKNKRRPKRSRAQFADGSKRHDSEVNRQDDRLDTTLRQSVVAAFDHFVDERGCKKKEAAAIALRKWMSSPPERMGRPVHAPMSDDPFVSFKVRIDPQLKAAFFDAVKHRGGSKSLAIAEAIQILSSSESRESPASVL